MGHLAKRLPLALLLAALVAPAAARANGFALDIQGLFSNGTATAGAAAGRDPAGQFANPAVIAALPGTQLVAGGMLIAAKAPYTDGGSTMFDGAVSAPLPGADADGAGTGLAPWLFASHRLSPTLTVGFSFTAPFGTATDYGRDSGFYGRYQGVESTIESVAFGPSVAWRPLEKLAVGASVSARRDHVVIGQSFELFSTCVGGLAAQFGGDLAAAAGACAGAGIAPGDGYGRFTADGWAWTAAVGATYEPAAGTTFGLAYRYEAKGEVKGHQSFDAAAQPLFNGVFGFTGDPKASMGLPLPSFVTLSASHQVTPAVLLVAAIQDTFWSRFDTLRLTPDSPTNGLAMESKQGFRDALRFSVGAAWKVVPSVELIGGLAYEQSPITTRYRQASLPEKDSGIAGLGAEVTLGRGVSLGAVYQRVQMLGTSRIDQTGALGDHLVGGVKGSANVGALQLGWRG